MGNWSQNKGCSENKLCEGYVERKVWVRKELGKKKKMNIMPLKQSETETQIETRLKEKRERRKIKEEFC